MLLGLQYINYREHPRSLAMNKGEKKGRDNMKDSIEASKANPAAGEMPLLIEAVNLVKEVRSEIIERARTCPKVSFRNHKSCGGFRKQNVQKRKFDSGEIVHSDL